MVMYNSPKTHTPHTHKMKTEPKNEQKIVHLFGASCLKANVKVAHQAMKNCVFATRQAKGRSKVHVCETARIHV